MKYVFRDMGVLAAGLLAASLFAQTPHKGVPEPQFESLLHQAFDLHQRQEYGESLPLLRRAHKLQPSDYFVNLLLGIDLLRTGKPSEAIPYLGHASRLRPGEDIPFGYLGEAYARLERYADAAKAYRRAVELAPDNTHSAVAFVDFSVSRFSRLSAGLRASSAGLAAEYRIEAMAHLLGDPQRRELLQRSAEMNENAPGIWSELALADIAAQDLSAAEEHLQRATERDRNDLRACEAQALLAAQKNDWKTAGERVNAIAARSPGALTQALQDWPASLQPSGPVSGAAAAFLSCAREGRDRCGPEVLLTRIPPGQRMAGPASVLFREQRWEQLSNLPPPAADDKLGWYYRGAALAQRGRCDAALPPLERALAPNPAAVQNSYWLALCYAREAGFIADRLARSDQQDAAVHMMKGDVLLRLRGDNAAALQEYNAALQTRPNDPAILARIAETELASGHMDAARDYALAALNIDPHQLGSKRTLARIAMDQRDYASALPYLRELTEQDPRDAATRVQLGTACAQTGALDEALANLAPPLAAGYPDQKGSLHYLLGTVLRKLGRADAAERAFATARELSDAFQQSSHRDHDEQR